MTEATSGYLNLPLRTEAQARAEIYARRLRDMTPIEFYQELAAGPGLELYDYQKRALEMLMKTPTARIFTPSKIITVSNPSKNIEAWRRMVLGKTITWAEDQIK